MWLSIAHFTCRRSGSVSVFTISWHFSSDSIHNTALSQQGSQSTFPLQNENALPTDSNSTFTCGLATCPSHVGVKVWSQMVFHCREAQWEQDLHCEFKPWLMRYADPRPACFRYVSQGLFYEWWENRTSDGQTSAVMWALYWMAPSWSWGRWARRRTTRSTRRSSFQTSSMAVSFW